MNRHKGVVLLWALRSPCNLGCRYCYFGTLDNHQNCTELLNPGGLSHVGCNDVCLDTILTFIASFTPNIVRRVFIAGGEPLLWTGIRQTIVALKATGSEVIVCTNGLPLGDEKISSWLVDAGVNAVSVSLDSYDPKYNDYWRLDRSGRGWYAVVEGINILLEKRREGNGLMKVGVYSVITRHNVDHIVDTARFVDRLGVDYFIIQPISLTTNHQLHDELSLNTNHSEGLADAINLLKANGLKIRLPNNEYLDLFLQTLTLGSLPIIKGCFSGRDLFFIEPDGSIWGCPSMYKIAETPPSQHISIIGRSAGQAFLIDRRRENSDCKCFSQDCVNMWQCMAFDDILR
jgi:sulfatase maturation enzyme AslB (radical SAM superfamily)